MIMFSNGQHEIDLGSKHHGNTVNKLWSAAECEGDYQGTEPGGTGQGNHLLPDDPVSCSCMHSIPSPWVCRWSKRIPELFLARSMVIKSRGLEDLVCSWVALWGINRDMSVAMLLLSSVFRFIILHIYYTNESYYYKLHQWKLIFKTLFCDPLVLSTFLNSAIALKINSKKLTPSNIW